MTGLGARRQPVGQHRGDGAGHVVDDDRRAANRGLGDEPCQRGEVRPDADRKHGQCVAAGPADREQGVPDGGRLADPGVVVDADRRDVASTGSSRSALWSARRPCSPDPAGRADEQVRPESTAASARSRPGLDRRGERSSSRVSTMSIRAAGLAPPIRSGDGRIGATMPTSNTDTDAPPALANPAANRRRWPRSTGRRAVSDCGEADIPDEATSWSAANTVNRGLGRSGASTEPRAPANRSITDAHTPSAPTGSRSSTTAAARTASASSAGTGGSSRTIGPSMPTSPEREPVDLRASSTSVGLIVKRWENPQLTADCQTVR